MWVLVVFVSGYITFIGTYSDFGACNRAGMNEVDAWELQGISASYECRPNRTYRPK